MNKTLLMNFDVDKENKAIKVEREFDAPLHHVWAAWTERELLDQWWAPKPWKTETKSLNFSEGGSWIYAMVGPEGEKHWARADYTSIVHLKSFNAQDGFCDEEGNINTDMPRTLWQNVFGAQAETTIVRIKITFNELQDLETIIQMGFKEGFTAALENLDAYFKDRTLQ